MNRTHRTTSSHVLKALLSTRLIVGGLPSARMLTNFATARAAAAGVVYTVNSTADTDDGACTNTFNGCTLREAINAANASIATKDTIAFNIPGPGVKTISPIRVMPIITDSVTIDGYTQPGARENTLAEGTDAVLLVELDGSARRASDGLVVAGGNTTIRGLVINSYDGSGIRFANTVGNTHNAVEGCFIGTDAAATTSNFLKGNGSFGINTDGARPGDNRIGGTTPVARNIISGNLSGGIFLFSSRNVIQGNLIGTDRTGTEFLGNGGVGVYAAGSNNVIGGTTPGAGNVIAYSGGVVVSYDQNNNSIRSNRIFENRDLGIDLGSDRVTPNDPGDGDAGPNNSQNFPVISMATLDSSNGDLTVQATLNSSPSTAFDVEFFSNNRCDETGHGEGQFFLGSTTATTDAGGNVSFTHVVRLSMTSAGSFITATAIDPNGNTSEFSRCVHVPAAQPNPTPTPPPLQLILEESGPAPAQAVALDSALLVRDPFPLINTANLLNRVDLNTRVILFVANLQLAQGEPPSSVVVNLVDGNSQSYEVSAEHVRPVPNFNFVQVIFRLPNNLPVGTCLITVKARGQVSNVGSIRLRI